MQTLQIPGTQLSVSRIGFGTAGMADWNREPIDSQTLSASASMVSRAIDAGITLFDHADCYAFGKAEEMMGRLPTRSPGLRDRIVVQSKCGQVISESWAPGQPIRVDLSSQHIIDAVEGSLKRLATDRLDILLLHTPDGFMVAEDIGAAFDKLHSSGKVLHFGVSNFLSSQIAYLQRYMDQKLCVNQVQAGLGCPQPLLAGLDLP